MAALAREFSVTAVMGGRVTVGITRDGDRTEFDPPSLAEVYGFGVRVGSGCCPGAGCWGFTGGLGAAPCWG